jgi:hypothetical protein
MKRLVVALALVLLPLPALADDAAYCAKLSELAFKYLGKYSRGESVPDLDTVTAADQCGRGNYASGIPTLERKLRANGLTLPPR